MPEPVTPTTLPVKRKKPKKWQRKLNRMLDKRGPVSVLTYLRDAFETMHDECGKTRPLADKEGLRIVRGTINSAIEQIKEKLPGMDY